MTGNHETGNASEAQFFEESLEDLYEHAPCGYVSTRSDGTFAKVNQTFLDWTGYRRDELLGGRRFQDLLTIGGKIYYETHYAPLLDIQGAVDEIAFEFVCRDGRRLPGLVSTVQKRDPSGTHRLNRTMIFKASERRQYERELRIAKQKAEDALNIRNQFLSLAAHELRTPLTSIIGHIQVLQRRVSKDESLSARDQRTIAIIADQAQRLYKMILSLLDLSRIDRGQLAIEKASVDLAGLIRRLVEELQLMLEDRRIILACPAQPLMVQGDELRLEQVFQNLLQNALKYSPHDKPIVIVVRQDDQGIAVDVQDAGIGIPQASLPQLFQRFYRADNVDQGNISGLGIGLYVAREIVQLHGGTVSVTSTEGQGSTFTVWLPSTARREQEHA